MEFFKALLNAAFWDEELESRDWERFESQEERELGGEESLEKESSCKLIREIPSDENTVG